MAKKRVSRISTKKRTPTKSSTTSSETQSKRITGRPASTNAKRTSLGKRTSPSTKQSIRRREPISTSFFDPLSAMAPFRPSALGLFNRNIFTDPFFTHPWEDMFNVPSVDDIIHKAQDMSKNIMKKADQMSRHVDTTQPGAYSSKSFYRTYTSASGQEPKLEIISQETKTNVDDKGRKFTEKWKNLERDNVKKSTHTKMIGSKGFKEMTTHNNRTGEEYEHIDYHHMNEKDLSNFNSEFDKGIKHVGIITPGMKSMLPDIGGWDISHDPFERKALGDWNQTSPKSAQTDTSERKGMSQDHPRRGSYTSSSRR